MAKRKAGTKKQDLLEFLMGCAENHGSESEPGMEVGDLQDILRACWSRLSKKEQEAVGFEVLTENDLARWMTVDEVTIGDMVIDSRAEW